MDAQAVCPLLGCDAGLYLTLTSCGPAYMDGSADPQNTTSWSVGCEQGHVVLLPPDTAQDYYEYDEEAASQLRDLLRERVS